MEEFFHSLQMKTELSDYNDDYLNTAERIEPAFTKRNWLGLGEHKNLISQDVYKIVVMSY